MAVGHVASKNTGKGKETGAKLKKGENHEGENSFVLDYAFSIFTGLHWLHPL